MQKVRVQNFQSIEDLTLEIEGFTVLTGSNNVGKSAFFRALRGVFTNPPPSFVRSGCKQSTVEVWSGDNYVKWEKGKGVNCYFLTTKDGSFLFDKPGASAPPEVCEAFGVGPVMLGDQKTWPQFADQFTGPVYLLDQPGHVLSDVVASPTRMQVLGKALAKAEKGRRSASSALKVKREDQKKLEARIGELEEFPSLSERVDALQEKQALAARIQNGHRKVSVLRDSLQEAGAFWESWSGFESKTWNLELETPLQAQLEVVAHLQQTLVDTRSELDSYQGLPEEGPQEALQIDLLQELIQVRKLRTALGKAREVVQSLDGMNVESVAESEKAQKVIRALEIVRGLQRALQDAQASVEAFVDTPSVFFEDASDLMEAITATQGALIEARGYSRSLKEGQKLLANLDREIEETTAELEALELPAEECPLCGATVYGGIDAHASH